MCIIYASATRKFVVNVGNNPSTDRLISYVYAQDRFILGLYYFLLLIYLKIIPSLFHKVLRDFVKMYII